MFVCLGNHCRSPLAHGYFEHLLKKHSLDAEIKVTSSGTCSWHLGDPPDPRMCSVAEKHGFSLDHIRGKAITESDLKTCDLILVMDKSNLKDVLQMDPQGLFEEKIKLLRTFDLDSDETEIPDPYYSGIFDEVYTIVSRSCNALLEQIMDS